MQPTGGLGGRRPGGRSSALPGAVVPKRRGDSLEILSPVEAGARYGTGSVYGVLLIETRRTFARLGGDPTELEGSRQFSAYDWNLERKRYPWKRAFLGSALGNVVGLGLGALAAGQCFDLDELAEDLRASRCGAFESTVAGIAAVGLPALRAGIGARILGATEYSHGESLLSSVAATAALLPGLAFLLDWQPSWHLRGHEVYWRSVIARWRAGGSYLRRPYLPRRAGGG